MTTPHVLVDRYELGELLGTGGMSEVRLAFDRELEREVALKIMRPELARDATFYERFRREAQNSALLNHPSIVRIFDTGEEVLDDGTVVPFIVMELVEGRTLRDIVRNDGPMEPKLALAVMADVAGALDFSHRKGIVHRDVKPANIMVATDGSVKVMDFGIARAISEYTNTLTETSAVLGTAQYLSPEQAQGQQVDGRSDVYSAGCVLYELLTGRPPFVGESAVAVAYQHVKEDPTPPSHVLEDLDPYADAVVMAAMAKNLHNRYQSAGEMRTDLIAVLSGKKPQAPMVLPPEPARASAPGSIAAQDTSAGDTKSRLRALALFRSGDDGPSATSQVTAEQRRRKRSLVLGVAVLVVLALIGASAYAIFGRSDREPVVAENTQVTVPNVAGENRDAAAAALRDLGLIVEVREQTDPAVPINVVITTDPTPGKVLDSGATITMVVSTGKPRISVPSVVGLMPEEARRTLIEAGLTVANEDRTAPSTPEAEGSVISTDPAAGASIPFDQVVQLTVGSGPEEIAVPDVVGQNENAARETLASLGFRVAVEQADSRVPVGEVIAQSTAPGTTQVKGATITVTVSRGNRFQMPNLVNLTVPQALDALRSAGWRGSDAQLVTQTQYDPDLTRVGKIFSQNPGVGEAATDVTVTVRVIEFGLIAGPGGPEPGAPPPPAPGPMPN